jgi:hypothetical protein
MGVFGSKEEGEPEPEPGQPGHAEPRDRGGYNDDDLAVLTSARGPMPLPVSADPPPRRHVADDDVRGRTSPSPRGRSAAAPALAHAAPRIGAVPRPSGTYTFRERLARNDYVRAGLWLASGGEFELRDEECVRGKRSDDAVRIFTLVRGTYTVGGSARGHGENARFERMLPSMLTGDGGPRRLRGRAGGL